MQVTLERLYSTEAGPYFTKNVNRISALRTALDLLSLPYPEWAKRKRPGCKGTGSNPAT